MFRKSLAILFLSSAFAVAGPLTINGYAPPLTLKFTLASGGSFVLTWNELEKNWVGSGTVGGDRLNIRAAICDVKRSDGTERIWMVYYGGNGWSSDRIEVRTASYNPFRIPVEFNAGVISGFRKFTGTVAGTVSE